MVNGIFDINRKFFEPVLVGRYRPERWKNSSPFANLPKVLAVDIDENKDNYTIVADLPGFEENDISVNIENNVLSITAQKTLKEEPEDFDEESEPVNLIRERVFHKRTERNINLGSRRLDVESISADLNNGVLTIVIPFAEESLPKSIEVKISKNDDHDEAANQDSHSDNDSARKLSVVKDDPKE